MKKLTHLGLFAFLTATLASCGGGGSSQEEEFKPLLDVNTSCSIVVKGSYDNFEALESEFDRFKEYYSNVKLSYVKIDTDIATVLEGNEKPNIFFSHPKMIGNDQYASVVAHMEDLSDPKLKLNLDCIRQSLIKRDSANKVYMVPVFSRTYGTLINKDLFTKEGIKIPTNWTELSSACKSFIEKGYKSPMMGYTIADKGKPSNGLQNTIAYPLFIAELAKNPEALDLANKLDPAAGKYMRTALEAVKTIVDSGYANLEECDKIQDSYDKVLLRFLDGDVPMMLCNGDTVSGAKKRETRSDAYKANPFGYAYYPLPTTEQGGYFIDSPSVQFSVNKDCDNLDMTNEFMRFLLRTKELDNLAAGKGLISPTKNASFLPVYAPFGDVPSSRTISPEVIGVQDQLANQIKKASFYVGRGELTVDEAIAKYGTL